MSEKSKKTKEKKMTLEKKETKTYTIVVDVYSLGASAGDGSYDEFVAKLEATYRDAIKTVKASGSYKAKLISLEVS